MMVSRQFQREIICHLGFQIINHPSFLCRIIYIYIYVHQKINTNCPWKQHLHLECSISAGQLQSYQATPANFKANHRHRRKSRTSSAVLDMAATDLPRWGACPNGNQEIWPSLCCLRINNLGISWFINVFWAAFIELLNEVTYSRMQRISLRMDWIYGTKGPQRLMAFLDVFGLLGHHDDVRLQPPNGSVVGFGRGTPCWRSKVSQVWSQGVFDDMGLAFCWAVVEDWGEVYGELGICGFMTHSSTASRFKPIEHFRWSQCKIGVPSPNIITKTKQKVWNHGLVDVSFSGFRSLLPHLPPSKDHCHFSPIFTHFHL